MGEAVQVIIHRGSHQIGGCCTEISYKDTRIAVDLGSPLPGEEGTPLCIKGLTQGESTFDAVFFTHYHGDHVGEAGHINPDIPIYMGRMTKAVIRAYKNHNPHFYSDFDIENAIEIDEDEDIVIGDIAIRAICSDHSSAGAFMFIIFAGNVKLLHTGDFRLHGKFREELLEKAKGLGIVDLLITEGTTLSRKSGINYTEEYVKDLIEECIQQKKYCFFILSASNFDRLQSISDCVPIGKYFLMDDFQKELFEIAESKMPERYRFAKTITYGRNLDEKMKRRGFAMLLRVSNKQHRDVLNKYMVEYPESSCLIYSMWSGYMASEDIKRAIDVAGSHFRIIHSSGHVTIQDLDDFVETINPEKIVIIHTDSDSDSPRYKNQLMVQDGDMIEIV